MRLEHPRIVHERRERANLIHFLKQPHNVGFNRNVGAFAGQHITPEGKMISAADWKAQESRWLPTDVDKTHVRGLMHPVLEPGKIAGWIAPPSNGTDRTSTSTS